MGLELTDEQRTAAAAGEERVYIEASPGSGKTTVATERYGVSRFGKFGGGRGVVALSFARSARGELEQRVRRRWGIDAMRWPHRVWTLDALHCAIVMHLLRSGAVQWPGGHTELTVVDSWRGHQGSWPRPAGAYVRCVGIHDGKVVLRGTNAHSAGTFFTTVAPYRKQLEDGYCTHDEIRQVLDAAIAQGSPLRANVADFLKNTISALIVDEVFDGNLVDLRIVWLASAGGIPTTLIGDPWQALYAFRGAQPQLVPQLCADLKFSTYPISQSFRFETPEMQGLATMLRAGQPTTLSAGAALECDVVLAAEWSHLWAVSDHVLPFSFGQVGNRVDAAIALLLDQVVAMRFASISSSGPDAAIVLGLDPQQIRTEGASQLVPVLEVLSAGTPQAATAALSLLKTTLVSLGSKNIPNLQASAQLLRITRLQALAIRLNASKVVPGLTIHQAKGREWCRVGVTLTGSDQARLAAGLSHHTEGERRLYVALTRAKQRTVLL